jgi:CDP-paratose 2-epimerase
MRCTMIGRPYSIYGYGGKQVRDNLHTADVFSAIEVYVRNPKPAAVYNLGGGRASNCSMIEAIKLSEEIAERELEWELLDEARIGDHRWWISDVQPFIDDYPEWTVTYGTEEILREIYELNAERWVTA